MANLKVNELNTANPAEIIDLKAEAEKGNEEAITAFKSLRGGCNMCWAPPPPPPPCPGSQNLFEFMN